MTHMNRRLHSALMFALPLFGLLVFWGIVHTHISSRDATIALIAIASTGIVKGDLKSLKGKKKLPPL